MRILKENGYNAVRSAHYPCSKALLDACDRQGMLVMDEFVDVWYIHKTEYDYVNHFCKMVEAGFKRYGRKGLQSSFGKSYILQEMRFLRRPRREESVSRDR